MFSIYLSTIAIKKYFNTTDDDFEHSLYWGTSFALMTIVFTTCLLNSYIPNVLTYSTSKVIHLLETFIFWYQFMALLIVVTDRFKKPLFIKTLKDGKCMRLVSWIIFIISISVPVMLTNIGSHPHIQMNAQGLISFQIVGDFYRDVAYESFHVLYAFFIAFLLNKIRLKYCYLHLGFVFIGLSEITQLLNIVMYKYFNEPLQYIEWGLAIVGIFIIFKEVHSFMTISRQEIIKAKLKEVEKSLLYDKQIKEFKNWSLM